MRLALWIAIVAVIVALYGRYVAHDWRITTVGGGLGGVAIGAWAISIRDEWKGNGD